MVNNTHQWWSLETGLPTNWQWISVQELGEVITGTTPSTSEPRYWGGSIPFVTPTDITESKYVPRTERAVTNEGAKKGRLIPENAVVVTCIASIGKNALASQRCLTNQQINSIVLKTDTNPDYVYYAITHRYRELQRLGGSTVQPIVKKSLFQQFQIPFPPYLEQRRIAEILDTVDRIITQTERLIEKLRAIKSGLLHDLLTRGIGEDGKIRGNNTIDFQNAGWKSRKLGDLFRLKHGYAFKGEYFGTHGPYIVVTPGNFFEEGGFRHKGEEEKYYTGEFPKEYMLNKDDLIVAMTEQSEGLLGASAIVPSDDKYLHNQRLGLAIGLDEIQLDKKFLNILFNSPHVRSQIQRTAAGTKVRHTSPDRIYQVEVMLPPLSEQGKIVEIVSSMERRIEKEEGYHEKMTRIKKGLMHDLLTGRVRVSIEEGVS